MVKLFLNEREESYQVIAPAAGDTIPVTFVINIYKPGTYTVTINKVSAGSLIVDDFFDPEIILLISCALIFSSMVLGVIYTLRRRKYGH